MAKRKKDGVENLVAQLIRSELEGQLSRLVRKARKKANREAGKLNDTLRLEYREGEGFVDAEYHEPGEEGKEESPGEGEY